MKMAKRNWFARIALITLAIVLSATARAFAADNAPRKLAVDEAVRIALASNQEYRIALARLAQAKERVNGEWGKLFPVLESEASLARQYAESGFMSLTDGQYDIRFVQIRLGVNPGVFYNSLAASRAAYTAAREEVRRVKGETESAVIRSYFGALVAGEMITLRRESLDLLKSNLRDVENLFRTGSVPRFELLQAQVQLKSQEPLLLEAENNYALALDTLNFHLGSGTVRHVPDGSVLESESYRMPAGDHAGKKETLVRTALRNRPEIIQIEMKRDAESHTRLAQSSFYLWPTFSVSGSYGRTMYLPNPVDLGMPPAMSPDFSQISGSEDWQTTWQVRAAATYRWGALIPVDQTRALEREAEGREREAGERLEQLKRRIAISVNAEYSRLVTACLTIRSQKDNVSTAEEGLRIARESYRAGVIKNSELLSAELARTNARAGYINAINAYYGSLAELKREVGSDDDGIIMEDIRK